MDCQTDFEPDANYLPQLVNLDEIQNSPDAKGKYSCPDCEYNVEYQSDLWYHMKRRHPDQMDFPYNNDQLF